MRSSTLAELRLRAKRLADMENSEYVSDPEWQDIINAQLCEVYDLLVSANAPDYYSSTEPYQTTAGVLTYDLPADFRSATCLYAVINTDERRPILPVEDYERVHYRPPQGVYDLELEYVQAPPLLTQDSDTFDGVSGWEELIVAMSARDALIKEESDIRGVQVKIQELRERVVSKSRNRGAGNRRIRDVDQAMRYRYPNNVNIRGFRIRGDSIEFYEPNVPFPY